MTIVHTRKPKARRKAAPLPIGRIVTAKKPGSRPRSRRGLTRRSTPRSGRGLLRTCGRLADAAAGSADITPNFRLDRIPFKLKHNPSAGGNSCNWLG